MVRGQRKQEETEETRRTILRVAQQLFMEYGYRAVTTRQLADACGLTQPALYHHFADKQDLYIAMVQEEAARVKQGLERIIRRHESLEERLKNIVLFLLHTTHMNIGLLVHDIRYEMTPEAQRQLSELYTSSILAPIASVFQQGLEQGTLRTSQRGGADPMTATQILMNVLSRFLSPVQQPDTTSAIHKQSNTEKAQFIVQFMLYGLAEPLAGQHEPTT